MVIALAGADLLYLRAAAWWLRSPQLSHLLNRRPDRFRISWREASSPFPGWLIVRDLELAGRTRRTRWSLHADEVRGAFSLPSLIRRHLALHDLVASGVAIRVARTLPPGDPPVAGQPTIEAQFAPFPREPGGPPRASPARPRWTIELTGTTLERIRELWLERWRFDGALQARGGLRLRLGRDAEVFATRLDLLDARLTVAGRPAAVHLRGTLNAFATPFAPRRVGGWGTVEHVTGEGRLAGEVTSLQFLLGLMPNVPWLAIEGGGGHLQARLRLIRGRLGEGSSAEVRAQSASIGFLEYRAQGSGVFSWRVGPKDAIGQADLSRCEIRRRGVDLPYARAPKLHLAVISRDLQMDGRLAELSGRADLPRVEVPDLRTYNDYLPAGSGLALTGGQGVFSTRLEVDRSGRARGGMFLSATDLAATGRGITLRGRCRVTVALASPDVMSRRFDLDGSRARCDGVEIRDVAKDPDAATSAGWWAEGTIGDGFVAPGAEGYLSLSGQVEARDALPIFALFGDRPGVKLAAFFFRDKRVAATGRIDLSSAAWQATGSGRAGPRLTADARLAGRRGQIDGALLAGIGRRRIGIELAGSERKIHWRGAADWFAAGVRKAPSSSHR
ncbi:MAG TPA: hypothetical protein VGS22_26115 [Thermoanaerobaculia bacterium]|nr:hypothetical protein [Thermoanaerobaculia bacterium]